MIKLNRQSGVTLVELLIGMLLGLIVIGGAISVFSTSVKGQADNIRLTRLNQDLRSMMSIMTRDIRRAGFNTSFPDVSTHFTSLQNNPFFDNVTAGATTDMAIYDSGSCIVYAYNRDEDPDSDGVLDETPPAVDSNERLGFKLVGTELRMRRSGSTNENCNNNNTLWQSITEPEVEITTLQFTLTTQTLNVTSMLNDDDDDGVLEATDTDGIPYGDDNNNEICDTGEVCNTCTVTSPGASGDPACLYIRNVTLTLTGRLAKDNAVTQTITEEIRIRNDKFLAAVP